MNVYEVNDIAKLLEGNPYVGRGIVVGKSEDGKSAVAAYFIMEEVRTAETGSL